MKNKTNSIVDFLLEHRASDPVWFHMPGHKGSKIYRENGFGEILDALMDCDITEIPGADNLFKAEDCILGAMERYKSLYGSIKTYMLINGSSAGLIAAIMATVPRGGKLLMARNCHKSIYNGISMIGGTPIYAYPEIIPEYGISGQVEAAEIQRLLNENPDCSAVILTSPNYYGICSDIEAIARVVHEAGKVLIVDQAHGAHLKFFDEFAPYEKPLAAENLGADIVINSTHKTLASFTQTAIVNICSDRIDREIFEEKLQLMESSSPSYVLMASLDVNARLLEGHGARLIRQWRANVDWFLEAAQNIPGLKIMKHPLLDDTKINLDMSLYGLDGLALESKLRQHGIFAEMATGNLTMCMTGIGNTRRDFDRLLNALVKISSTEVLEDMADNVHVDDTSHTAHRVLAQAGVPVHKERVPLAQATGRVCSQAIIPYPPGIPIVCPGEIYDAEILAYIEKLYNRGFEVMGIDKDGHISVGR